MANIEKAFKKDMAEFNKKKTDLANQVERVVMRNQCQGCQAGWAIEEHNPWPKGSKSMHLHVAEGGYKDEKVMCTKDHYVDA